PGGETTVSEAKGAPASNLGFLTVLHEASGYLGGYLVTNLWGRPLEFRLSTAVQPNRVQQILYAGTLPGYVCADLIGKRVGEKTTVPVQLVLTCTEAALDLRLSLVVRVVWVGPPERAEESAPAKAARANVRTHPRFPADAQAVQEVLQRLSGLDLTEPFPRIPAAVGWPPPTRAPSPPL